MNDASLRKSCSFGLLCLSFVNVYQFLYVSSFPFDFEDVMWDLFLIIPDQCLSNHFVFIFLLQTQNNYD